MSKRIYEKFVKYWAVIHGLIAVATVLDLKYKMKLIEYYSPRIYESESSIHIMRVHSITCDLVKEYQSKYSQNEQSFSKTNIQVSQPNVACDAYVNTLQDYELFVSKTNAQDNYKSKLDMYLEAILPRNFEFYILAW